jgi:hypothetical protein
MIYFQYSQGLRAIEDMDVWVRFRFSFRFRHRLRDRI